MQKILFLIGLVLILCQPALGGYFEIGFSGTYRKVYLPSESDSDAFDETQSLTSSLAYYFYEMAAIELNYTKGSSQRFVPSTTANVRTTHFFSLLGTDLILTFAKRTASFIPYIKFGVGMFLEKEVAYEFNDGVNPPTTQVVQLENTLVPSAGGGLRVRLTKSMQIKIGAEVWSSDALANQPRLDWGGKAGVSWFF